MSEKNHQAKKNKRKMMKDSRELWNYNKRSARVYTPTPITSLPPILWPTEVVQKKPPKYSSFAIMWRLKELHSSLNMFTEQGGRQESEVNPENWLSGV